MGVLKINSCEEKVKLPSAETISGVYHPQRNTKAIRILTVVVYILCVSLAAIMLSLYYIFIWDPTIKPYTPKVNTNCEKIFIAKQNSTKMTAEKFYKNIFNYYYNLLARERTRKYFQKLIRATLTNNSNSDNNYNNTWNINNFNNNYNHNQIINNKSNNNNINSNNVNSEYSENSQYITKKLHERITTIATITRRVEPTISTIRRNNERIMSISAPSRVLHNNNNNGKDKFKKNEQRISFRTTSLILDDDEDYMDELDSEESSGLNPSYMNGKHVNKVFI